MDYWRCDCPICRYIVKPVLRRLVGELGEQSKEQERQEPVEQVEAGAEKQEQPAKESSQLQELAQRFGAVATPLQQAQEQGEQPVQAQQAQQPQSPPANRAPQGAGQQESSGGQQGGGQEQRVVQVRAEVPKEVIDRIDQLEQEVSKIKTFVKASIEGIKATLVDLRSAMAELSNPFNILRKYADLFFEEGEANKLSTIAAAHIRSPEAPQSSEQGAEHSSKEQEQPMKLDLDTYQKLAAWVDEVLQKVPPKEFSSLIDRYVEIGVIDRRLGEALKKVADIVNELRRHGIDVKAQYAMLAKLLRELTGGEAREGAEELLKLIEGG